MNRKFIYNTLKKYPFTFIKPEFVPPLTEKELRNKLRDFPEICNNTLIIVNDQFRSTPSNKIIKVLRELGKLEKCLTFVIATGTHNPPSMDEAAEICNASKNDKIILNCVDEIISPAYAGTTSMGTEVYYNPEINSYGSIITIGSVEPHYFAGFTGGAKSLMPGISALKTIVQNHSLAMDKSSELMKTDGNPVFEDIWEAAALIHPLENIYSVQMVNSGDSILHISHGNIRKAFQDSKAVSGRIYGKVFREKFDRILTFVEPPLNKNLYQSHKSIANTKNVLKQGGSLVVVSECSRSNEKSAFLEKLDKLGSPQSVMKKLEAEKYEFGDHKAYKLAETADAFELLYLGNLPSETTEKAFMKKITEPQLLELCRKWHEEGERVLIDEAGGFTAYEFKPEKSL